MMLGQSASRSTFNCPDSLRERIYIYIYIRRLRPAPGYEFRRWNALTFYHW